MGKVRIPLDLDEDLKQDFIDRLESHHGFEGKVKINTLLQNLMHFVICSDEFELGDLLFRSENYREMYNVYRASFKRAKDLGLLDGLDIKRGNPRKGEVEHYLMQISFLEDKDDGLDEIRKSFVELDRKIKADEIFEEDKENFVERKRKAYEYVCEFGFKKPY